jgi:hypothetical protein
MSVISTSLRTGINAATPDAARFRVQRQRAAQVSEAPGGRDGARVARHARWATNRDTYEAGAAAYAGRPRQAQAPDLQRFEARIGDRSRRDNPAGGGRAAR